MTDDSFAGKVALVTGGGTGIGRCAALKFAARGCRVVISGRTLSSLEAVRAESDRIECIRADMELERDVEALAQRTLELAGRIDIVVNNAGMFGVAPIDMVEGRFVEKMLRTNVIGPLLLIRHCCEELTKSQGAIVNVSSTVGHKAASGAIAYAVSKAAVEHATRCLALELAPRKIRVNCVAPGPTDTGILGKSGLTEDMIQASNTAMESSVPLKRRGKPDEVADWIVHLADPAASWMTGGIICVDGGFSVA